MSGTEFRIIFIFMLDRNGKRGDGEMFGFRAPCDADYLELLSQQHDTEDEGKVLDYGERKPVVTKHGWAKKGGKKKKKCKSIRQLELFAGR